MRAIYVRIEAKVNNFAPPPHYMTYIIGNEEFEVTRGMRRIIFCIHLYTEYREQRWSTPRIVNEMLVDRGCYSKVQWESGESDTTRSDAIKSFI